MDIKDFLYPVDELIQDSIDIIVLSEFFGEVDEDDTVVEEP